MVKQSVAVAIYDTRDRNRVLIVQRPADDEELPNAWGLPASSLKPGESFEEAVRRTGRDKLGVVLRPIVEVQHGSVERAGYALQMRLFEAEIESGDASVPQSTVGVTQYTAWRWGSSEDLQPAAEAGSLCCRLFIQGGPPPRFPGLTHPAIGGE
jgi:ADP-ribose pyrophosphatase YjhB (NUDIX family)